MTDETALNMSIRENCSDQVWLPNCRYVRGLKIIFFCSIWHRHPWTINCLHPTWVLISSTTLSQCSRFWASILSRPIPSFHIWLLMLYRHGHAFAFPHALHVRWFYSTSAMYGYNHAWDESQIWFEIWTIVPDFYISLSCCLIN